MDSGPDLANPGTAPGLPNRVASLDALRGFDMFWISGAGGSCWPWPGSWQTPSCLAPASERARGVGGFRSLRPHHAALSVPGRRLPALLLSARPGTSWPPMAGLSSHGQAFRHPILAGYGGPGAPSGMRDPVGFHLAASLLQHPSVHRLRSVVAGLAVLHLSRKGQVTLCAALLVGYWALLSWVPVPGHGSGF